VSIARAVRPTTDRPVAWVAADRRSEVDQLLEWLKVDRVVAHDGPALADIAVLDLPDVDSVVADHRATVDALLPRIDAVAWIVDPEKYDDAGVHAYWRTLVPHADRLRFVLNKADRLADDDRRLVADDLRARLVADGIPRPVIHILSARTGEGIAGLRDALADAGHAKVIIAAKLETDRARAADRLARAAGIDPEVGHRPLLPDEDRQAAAWEAVTGALALIDPDGLARQVRSAVVHRARVSGGSLLGRVVALVGTLTGQKARHADPAAYLRDWRSRGAIGRVLNPLRKAMVDAAAAVPSRSRGRILEALRAPTAEADVVRVLDRTASAASAELEIPSSPVWPVIGALQLVAGAVLVFAVGWVVILFVAGGGVPVETVGVPLLGPIPMPLALLAGAFVVSVLLAWLLGLHARWVGRRLAARVSERIDDAVREAVIDDAFAGLERVEAARRVIAAAAVRP
jgi:hypothetical protein